MSNGADIDNTIDLAVEDRVRIPANWEQAPPLARWSTEPRDFGEESNLLFKESNEVLSDFRADVECVEVDGLSKFGLGFFG